jgi:hypothetical protein
MIYVFAVLLVAVAALSKLLVVYAYEQGRRDEVVKRADLQAKLKAQQTNVVMAPKTVDDTISDLDNGTF